MNPLRIIPLLLALLLTLTGCSSHELAPDYAALAKKMTGVTWQVTNIHGRTVLDDTSITMVFGEDGSVRGNGGGNDFTGRYATDETSISITDLASGEKACPPGTTEQEYTLLLMLGQITGYAFDDEILLLTDHTKGKPIVLVPEGEGSGGWLW